MALNKENRVGELTPAQIKNVFDEELTNWNEVGGEDLPIRLSVWRTSHCIIRKSSWALPTKCRCLYYGAGGAYAWHYSLCTAAVHCPSGLGASAERQHHFGEGRLCRCRMVSHGNTCCAVRLLPLITGTLWVSLFAILFALPFGLSVAIYMSEVANSRVRNLLKPIIELLSGIPSVVYGFFGLIVIVPFCSRCSTCR